MPHNWKMLGLTSLAILALVLPAQAGGNKDGQSEQDKLKEIQESIKKMDEGLQKAFADIRKDMDASTAEMKQLKAAYAEASLKAIGATMRLEEVEKLIGQLRADLDALRKRLPAENISQYPPTNDKAALEEVLRRLSAIEQKIAQSSTTTQRQAFYTPTTTTGRILLLNQHAEDVLFVVNGRTYRVAPGGSAALDAMPAGAFTYEVISPSWGLVRSLQTRVLAPQETFTITATP